MRLRLSFLLLALLFLPFVAFAQTIHGSGSSAAHPLYMRIADAYSRVDKTTALQYDPAGSSAGIRQITARSVDFGASDVALKREDAERNKLMCFPSAISGVVPVVNLPGVKAGDLQLTGAVLADIFARRITTWNDARVVALNPRVNLPHGAITTVVRSDGSGTTYNFTDYLSRVSTPWKEAYGNNFTIAWAAGSTAVKGSGGVVDTVKKTSGAIAYVDYNYVLQEHLAYARMRNADGKFVAPSPEAFSAALDNSGWKQAGGFEEMLTNKPGAASWPITMGTFVIVPRSTAHPAATVATLKLFTWGFLFGDAIVGEGKFVHLPERVQARVFAEFMRLTDTGGKPLDWSLADIMALPPR